MRVVVINGALTHIEQLRAIGSTFNQTISVSPGLVPAPSAGASEGARAELIARVWGNDYTGSLRTIDIHVRRLRSKLGSALPLYTVRGAGYLLKVGQDWDASVDETAVPASGVSGVERTLAASTAA